MESTNSAETPPLDAKKKGFTSSNAVIICGEQKFSLRILKMIDSTMIFVDNADLESFDEMGVALPVKSDKTLNIVGTTLLGAQVSSESQMMAEKLTRRFNRQMYVSYNAKMDRMVGPLLEKKLAEYIRCNEKELV